MVGELGAVRSDLEPDGMVFAFGELWSASIDPASGLTVVPAGTPIIVTGIQSMRLFVRPATDEELASEPPTADRPNPRQSIRCASGRPVSAARRSTGLIAAPVESGQRRTPWSR